MSQIRPRGKYICPKQSVFAWSDMTLTVDLPTPFMVIAHPMTILSWREMSHIERYALDKNNENSAMPLTVDIETWFKVTANPLPKSTM